jgi:hypothetical protein
MNAGKCRKQGRMDIHDPSRKSPEEFRGEYPHKTGHYHQLHTGRFKYRDRPAIITLACIELPVIDHHRAYPMFSASLKGKGIRIIADDYSNFRIQGAGFGMINDGLKIRAASRYKNTDADLFHHGVLPVLYKHNHGLIVFPLFDDPD